MYSILHPYQCSLLPLKAEQEEGPFQGKQREWFHCFKELYLSIGVDSSKKDFLDGRWTETKNNSGSAFSWDSSISEAVVKIVQLGNQVLSLV